MVFNRALFFDKKGEYIGKTSFKSRDSHFKYKGKRYVNDTSNLSYFREDFYLIFFKRRTFFYQIDKPMPINFTTKLNSKEINTEQLNVIIETDVIKKINDLAKTSIFDKINVKTALILLVIFIIGVYVLKGGKLF